MKATRSPAFLTFSSSIGNLSVSRSVNVASTSQTAFFSLSIDLVDLPMHVANALSYASNPAVDYEEAHQYCDR